MEHVADTISDWTKEEELKREAMQLRNLSPAESPKGTAACQHKALAMRLHLLPYKYIVCFVPGIDEMATDSAEEQVTLEPFIRKDSLKVSTN